MRRNRVLDSNEDKAGSLAMETWDKWKNRILCSKRIPHCKAVYS